MSSSWTDRGPGSDRTGNVARYALIAAAAIAAFSVGFAVVHGYDRGAAESGAPEGTIRAESMDSKGLARAIPDLEARVEQQPDDEQGWALLGLSYFQAGRFADAARAYGRALELDPADPRTRYFEGIRKNLAGDHARAIDDWIALLRDTPANAPWKGDLRRLVTQVSEEHGIDVSGRVPPPDTIAQDNVPETAIGAIPGPGMEEMRTASRLPQGQQEMMIDNMVNGLDQRLSRNPNDPDGWIMLMRSRMQLGQTDQAEQAWRRAREAFSGDSARLERINASARALGVPGA